MAFMFRAASAAFFLILSLARHCRATRQPSASIQGLSFPRAPDLRRDCRANHWLAGIEIALDPGFKTYWRNPGDSGLPPRFDWSRSENVAGAEVRWPAPNRHEDAGGVAYVYGKQVVLPVLVKRQGSGQAGQAGPCRRLRGLQGHLHPGPCGAEPRISTGDGPGRSAIEAALAQVPRPQALGAQGDLSVLAVEPVTAGQAGLSRHDPRARRARSLRSSPRGRRLVSLDLAARTTANRFTVTVEEKPKDASGPCPCA